MNFEDWYKANEHYLVAQPFTNFVAAAAWIAGRSAEREKIAEFARSQPGRFASFADADSFADFVLDGSNEMTREN